MALEFDLVSVMPGRPGWIELRLRGAEAPPRVIAKLEKRDGRIAVSRLILDGDLDPAVLRQIPLARIETVLNTPHGNTAEAAFVELDADEQQAQEDKGWIFPSLFGQVDEALDDYLARSADQLQLVQRTYQPQPREPLGRPDGTDPDGFARKVAAAYSDFILAGSKAPAVDIAGEADVPVATVHRWIAEARRRGHLPPARKGRAG
jgi:hypothetical protein